MDRQEFLSRLRACLSGRIAPALVEENIHYYEDYINTRIRLGESERSVLEALGDPRFIARSIVDADSVRTGKTEANREYFDDRNESSGRRGRIRRFFQTASLPSWAFPAMAAGVLLLVFVILGLVFSLVMHMLAWLWPLIAIAMIVIFFVKLFRDWLH